MFCITIDDDKKKFCTFEAKMKFWMTGASSSRDEIQIHGQRPDDPSVYDIH